MPYFPFPSPLVTPRTSESHLESFRDSPRWKLIHPRWKAMMFFSGPSFPMLLSFIFRTYIDSNVSKLRDLPTKKNKTKQMTWFSNIIPSCSHTSLLQNPWFWVVGFPRVPNLNTEAKTGANWSHQTPTSRSTHFGDQMQTS